MYEHYIKRMLDVIFSCSMIVLLSPLILILLLLVRTKLGTPILFKQKRPGKNNKIFIMYKLRTMSDIRDKSGKLLPDEQRLTRFGKILRSTSMDELPELLNILKGEMSLVGPRPQLVRDLVFMTDEQRKRHNIRQGLTGLAQVNGRNSISWEDKFKFDLIYLNQITFLKDLGIILKTIQNVFAREGITAEGMATAEDLGEYLLKTNAISQKDFDEGLRLAEKLLDD